MSRPLTGDRRFLFNALGNWLIVVLLAAILATQVLLLLRMPAPPPTIGTLQRAKTPEAMAALLSAIPLVRVQGGTVDDVTGTIEVTVENQPLKVAVENQPLEVEVYR